MPLVANITINQLAIVSLATLPCLLSPCQNHYHRRRWTGNNEWPRVGGKNAVARSHGITRDANLMTQNLTVVGIINKLIWALTIAWPKLQGGIGVSQMNYLDDFVTRRHQLASVMMNLLTDLPIILPYRNPANYSGFHLYPIQLTTDSGKTRKQVFDSLRAQISGVNVHLFQCIPQPYYAKLGFKQGDFPHTESYYAQTIGLPLYYDLKRSITRSTSGSLKIALAQALA